MAKQTTQSQSPARSVSPQTAPQTEKQNGEAKKRKGRKSNLPEGYLDTKARNALKAFPGSEDSLEVVPAWDYTVNKPPKKKLFKSGKRDALIREFYSRYREDLIKQGSKIPYVQPGDAALTEWPADYDSAIHKPLTANDFVDELVFIDGKISSLRKEIAEWETEREIKSVLKDKPAVAAVVTKTVKAKLSDEEFEQAIKMLQKLRGEGS